MASTREIKVEVSLNFLQVCYQVNSPLESASYVEAIEGKEITMAKDSLVLSVIKKAINLENRTITTIIGT